MREVGSWRGLYGGRVMSAEVGGGLLDVRGEGFGVGEGVHEEVLVAVAEKGTLHGW